MSYNVLWSQEASNSFEEIVTYIFHKWGTRAAEGFEQKVTRVVQLLQIRPGSFQNVDGYPACKKVLVTRQTYLFYQIEGEEVVLLYFWETARDPEDLRSVLGE